MERSVIISVSILLLSCLQITSTVAAQDVAYINAYRAFYEAEKHYWDMKATNVYCATWDADKSLEWRSKYAWTAFGTPDSNVPHGEEACGKCLQVTNAGKEAIVITVLRIVDTCSNCLEVDKPAFDKLDVDKVADTIGHLNVSYTFVDCNDAEIRLYSGH